MTAGQSRSASALESVVNTVVGLIVSLALQMTLFPALGHDFGLAKNLLITVFFTVTSTARGYTIRRIFNAKLGQTP
jgi:uncharacterized membrane protein